MDEDRKSIDFTLGMAVAIYILISFIFSLQIKNSRRLVFALGIGMLIVGVLICGVVIYRMCIWAGPIDEVGNHSASEGTGVAHINSQNDILRIVASLPPSYDSVVKFDIPPPPYDCIVIDMEQCKDEPESEDKPTVSTESSAVHM